MRQLTLVILVLVLGLPLYIIEKLIGRQPEWLLNAIELAIPKQYR